MSVCSRANRRADRLTEIRTVSLKVKYKKSEWVVFSVNFHIAYLHDPKAERLFVSVNGKDTEVQL